MILVDRDYEIFREIDRWRFCLGRHIQVLAGFTGQRACDRRLRSLIEAGFLERSKIIYGLPSVYSLTHKAKMLVGANKRQDKIRLDNIIHDIVVLDTVIYFITKLGVQLKNIVTEKQMHSKDGFSVRNHHPDFIFTHNDKTYCIEVELSLKSKDRLEKNIRANFLAYDVQIWVIGENIPKVTTILNDCKIQYQNIKIIDIEEIKNHVKNIK